MEVFRVNGLLHTFFILSSNWSLLVFFVMEKELYNTPSVEEIVVVPTKPMLVDGSGGMDDPSEEEG